MLAAAVAPPEWFIVFRRTTTLKLADWLACGRYKHVVCFGPVPAIDGWLFYDFGAKGTSIAVVPDARANEMIGAMCDDALVLRWVPPVVVTGWRLKIAFLCTSAVAHLTGVPSSALRPDRFLRDCLANGAEIVVEDRDGEGKDEPREEGSDGEAREGIGGRGDDPRGRENDFAWQEDGRQLAAVRGGRA